MSDLAIRVENLSKEYRIGSHQNGDRRFGYKSLRDVLTEALAAPLRRASRLLRGEAYAAAEMNETIWALKDVSFEVKRGEVVGIIGRNGAGKSTLLKILSRITEPTEGQAAIYGRVGSLLEVGTGFHPELTGRENIYLNGAILGMRRVDIERQFDEIVAFAEVEKFIDTPVKHYSSGMYLRLAFAVAAHLEPEILLVDEVLAVGDAQFQKKCLGKMGDVAEQGRTVLFISHNMAAMRTLCQRGILLNAGQVAYDGDISLSVLKYMDHAGSGSGSILDRVTYCHPDVQLERITLNGFASDEYHLSSETRSLTIEVTGRLARPMRLELEARIYDLYEMPLAFFSPGHERGQSEIRPSGAFHLHHTMMLPRIMRGEYNLNLFLTEPGMRGWVSIKHAVRLIAEGTPTTTGRTFSYYKGAGWVLLPEKSKSK